MKCVVLREAGEPLRPAELPDPVQGPEELLIRVEACGVCHSDLHLADGDWSESLARRIHPTILGHEIVGIVVARGVAAQAFDIGQRVGVGWVGESCRTCDYCREGNDNLCIVRRVTGVDRAGGWASLATVHVSQAVVVPEGIGPVAAAPLFCAGVTVYRGMKKALIRPADRVVVFGIGGLGHIGVQLARMWGAEVIAVDREPSKLELAQRLGASHRFGVDEAVAGIQALGGAHVAVVTAASVSAYDLAVSSLRKGGAIVVVGLPNEPLRWAADDLATNEIRILGSAVGSRTDMKELLELAALGKIECITEVLPLDSADDALGMLRRGEVTGRLVLVP